MLTMNAGWGIVLYDSAIDHLQPRRVSLQAVAKDLAPARGLADARRQVGPFTATLVGLNLPRAHNGVALLSKTLTHATISPRFSMWRTTSTSSHYPLSSHHVSLADPG